jgi:Bifunctional DNA primase/polymerase, N-terminal
VAKLVRKNYDIHTWRVVTGGGGEHIICAAASPPLQSGKIVRGVDIKATRGYIVGVGCRHISGGRYHWFPGCRPGEVDLEATPAWVIRALEAPKKTKASPHKRDFYNTCSSPPCPAIDMSALPH